MLPLKLMSGKMITIFDQDSLLNITVSLHLDSHLQVIGDNNMAKKVEILVSIALVDADKHFNKFCWFEAREFLNKLIDSKSKQTYVHGLPL